MHQINFEDIEKWNLANRWDLWSLRRHLFFNQDSVKWPIILDFILPIFNATTCFFNLKLEISSKAEHQRKIIFADSWKIGRLCSSLIRNKRKAYVDNASRSALLHNWNILLAEWFLFMAACRRRTPAKPRGSLLPLRCPLKILATPMVCRMNFQPNKINIRVCDKCGNIVQVPRFYILALS